MSKLSQSLRTIVPRFLNIDHNLYININDIASIKFGTSCLNKNPYCSIITEKITVSVYTVDNPLYIEKIKKELQEINAKEI